MQLVVHKIINHIEYFMHIMYKIQYTNGKNNADNSTWNTNHIGWKRVDNR